MVYFQINHSIISNTFLIFELPYIVQKVRKVNAMYFYPTLSFKVVIYAQFWHNFVGFDFENKLVVTLILI